MNLAQRLRQLYPDHVGPLAAAQVNAAWETLTAETDTVQAETTVTERGLMLAFSSLSDGEAFLQSLEAVAPANAVVARAIRWLRPGAEGLDVNLPETRGMLAQLVANGVLTQTQSDAVLALADRSVPRWPGLSVESINRAWETA